MISLCPTLSIYRESLARVSLGDIRGPKIIPLHRLVLVSRWLVLTLSWSLGALKTPQLRPENTSTNAPESHDASSKYNKIKDMHKGQLIQNAAD